MTDRAWRPAKFGEIDSRGKMRIRSRVAEDAWAELVRRSGEWDRARRMAEVEEVARRLAEEGISMSASSLERQILGAKGERAVGLYLDSCARDVARFRDCRPLEIRAEDVDRLEYMAHALRFGGVGRYGGFHQVSWRGPIWSPDTSEVGARPNHDITVAAATPGRLLELASRVGIIVGLGGYDTDAPRLSVVIEAIAIGWLAVPS